MNLHSYAKEARRENTDFSDLYSNYSDKYLGVLGAEE